MTLKASQLIAEAFGAGQATADILIAGKQGEAGDNGLSKPPAQSGKDGRNASCHWLSGCSSSMSGTKGDNGVNGDNAKNGLDGGDAPKARIFVGFLQGTVFVFARGGDGGDGGKGGDGGNGGNGGKGGDGDKASIFEAFGSPGGDGGNGGNGGDGGNGGRGGNGSLIQIKLERHSPLDLLVPFTEPSRPGRGGQGGAGGSGGSGGNGGGSYGTHGFHGSSGAPGKDGIKGGTPCTFNIQEGPVGTVRGKDITVEPGTTYVVTDKEYFFNSVTIKQGGVLSIQTNYPVSINSLFKVPAGARKSRAKASASPPKSKAKSSGGKTKSKGKA